MTHQAAPDFSAATKLLLDYNYRAFCMQDMWGIIQSWINEGCDLEKDIVPAIKSCIATKKDIGHVIYFTKAVHRARDMRANRSKSDADLARQAEASKPLTDAERARHIAFVTRKLHRCMPAETRWLEGYESRHGRVEV